MKGLKITALALLIVFSSLFVTASVIRGLEPLKLKKVIYSPDEAIDGSFNISLANESGGSIISIGLNTSMSLLDFLNKVSLTKRINFSCIPSTCEEVHESVGSSYSKKNLNNGTFVLGPIITGRDIELRENIFGFTLSANGSDKICGISPVSVDILNDGTVDWQYLEPSDELCGGSPIISSCYDILNADKSFDITTTGYCEGIKLPVSGKFKLSALVKKNQGDGDLNMFLYNKETGISSQCDLPEPNSTSFIEMSCMVDFLVPDSSDSQKHYVCIKDDTSNNAYSVQGEASSPTCGFVGLPVGNNTIADFALLAQPTAIAPFNMSKKINSYEFEKTHDSTLSSYLQEYINSKYNGDCLNSCVIPVKITSAVNVVIKDLFLSYCFQGGICQTTNSIFDIKKRSSLISMEYTELPLSAANFSIKKYGDYNITLQIGQEVIGSKNISIEKVPIIKNILYIKPQAAVPTFFMIQAYSPKNNSLKSYEVEFGDGSSETSENNTVSHTYTEVGMYNVKVTVTDSEGFSNSRIFSVMIGAPKEILNDTILTKKSALRNMTSIIGAVPLWYKGVFEKEINLIGLEGEMRNYENQFNSATSDANYVDIMTRIKSLAVPVTIYNSEVVTDFPIAIDIGDVTPMDIESLDGGTYKEEDEEFMRNSILYWQADNIILSADSRVVGVVMDDNSKRDIITLIDLAILPKSGANISELYLVIALPPEKLKFDADYKQRDLGSAVGLKFSDFTGKRISFAVYGRTKPEDLIVFASPRLNELPPPINVTCNVNGKCEVSRGENWRNCREDCKPVGRVIFLSILSLIIIIAIYTLLQKWYKTKYESYLFKSRMDLVNITIFIKKSLDAEMSEKEVREKLKNAGWTPEQIDYCFKSIRGKIVGLPGIRFLFPKRKKEKRVASASTEIKKVERISNFRTIPKA